MNLIKHIGPGQILPGLRVDDKWELIERMLDVITAHPVCQKQTEDIRRRIRSAVLAREKEMSTAVGHGFAYPHARMDGFKGFAVALATLKEPIPYEGSDDEPVRIACMVVTSLENPTVGLRIISLLSGLLEDSSERYLFLTEHSPQRLHNHLRSRASRLDLDLPLTARDIMRPPAASILPQTSLPDVARIMLQHRLEEAPVTDPAGRVLGQVTCDLLFQQGIPDFFGQLHSVSFIREFDPFDRYFESELHAVAGDIMSHELSTVAENATLMEIIHLLSVHGHPKVYVLRDSKLVGVIDYIAVMDRVLNF